MRDALRAAGLTVLENEALPLQVRGCRIWAVGLADATTRTPALETVHAVPHGEPVLVLSHNPDVFPFVRHASR